MSKSSQNRNAVGTAKSIGKQSSQTANSFAQSKGSANVMANTQKSNGQVGPNIVIDIESESLTYN